MPRVVLCGWPLRGAIGPPSEVITPATFASATQVTLLALALLMIFTVALSFVYGEAHRGLDLTD